MNVKATKNNLHKVCTVLESSVQKEIKCKDNYFTKDLYLKSFVFFLSFYLSKNPEKQYHGFHNNIKRYN